MADLRPIYQVADKMNGLIVQWGESITSSALLAFPVTFSSADSWKGTTQNIKNTSSIAECKIYKATDGGHYYAYSPGYNNEIVSWIAIGY